MRRWKKSTRKVNENACEKADSLRVNNSIIKGVVYETDYFHEETKTFHLYNEKNQLYLMCIRKWTSGTIIFWKNDFMIKADFSYLVEKMWTPK